MFCHNQLYITCRLALFKLRLCTFVLEEQILDEETNAHKRETLQGTRNLIMGSGNSNTKFKYVSPVSTGYLVVVSHTVSTGGRNDG